MPNNSVELFYSYAHEDEELRKELEKRLISLKREKKITGWHDGELKAGVEWKREIVDNLNKAQVILLLVSSDFIASDFIHNEELNRAMERHDAGDACVIPIILRPCEWENEPYGKLQALPDKALPVTNWPNRDDAFLSVSRGIRKRIENLIGPKDLPREQEPLPPPPVRLEPPPIIPEPRRRPSIGLSLGAVLAVAILIALVVYFTTSSTFHVTIHPVGLDRAPSEFDRIILNLGQDTRSAQIESSGVAVFKELPSKYQKEKVQISADIIDYEMADPNGLYQLSESVELKLKKKAPEAFDVSVKVTDSANKIVQSGKVILELDSNTQYPADINQNGEAKLQGIPRKFKGRDANITVFSTGYENYSKSIRLSDGILPVTIKKPVIRISVDKTRILTAEEKYERWLKEQKRKAARKK